MKCLTKLFPKPSLKGGFYASTALRTAATTYPVTDVGVVRYWGPLLGVPRDVARDIELMVEYHIESRGCVILSYECRKSRRGMHRYMFPVDSPGMAREYLMWCEYERSESGDVTVYDIHVFHVDELMDYGKLTFVLVPGRNDYIRRDHIPAELRPKTYRYHDCEVLVIPRRQLMWTGIEWVHMPGEDVKFVLDGGLDQVSVTANGVSKTYSWEDDIALSRDTGKGRCLIPLHTAGPLDIDSEQL